MTERKHGPWTIKASECLHRDSFVEFWVEDVIKPDGEPGRYATLKMLPGVLVMALDSEGFVYLVRSFRYAVGRECVEAVMGGVEEGEAADEAACRELREEASIEAEEFLDLGLVDAITSQVFSPSRIYLARGLRFREPEREPTEKLELFKVTLDEAVQMVMDGRITQASSAVLILKASRVVKGC